MLLLLIPHFGFHITSSTLSVLVFGFFVVGCLIEVLLKFEVDSLETD